MKSYNILTREGIIVFSLIFYDKKIAESVIKQISKNKKLTIEELYDEEKRFKR